MIGEYEGTQVSVNNGALYMRGIGYLSRGGSDWLEVQGGPFAGETVAVTDNGLRHQGIVYERR